MKEAVISTRVTAEILKYLNARARKEERTRSQIVCQIITATIKQELLSKKKGHDN